jgi:protein tyrosine/serine phosphatase
MKTKFGRSEKLRHLLRATHQAREHPVSNGQWTRQAMRRIRYLAASEAPVSTAWLWEPFFWRWFTAGGVATAVMALVLLNFQFVPDADLWSFLIYENETMNMMQAYLY